MNMKCAPPLQFSWDQSLSLPPPPRGIHVLWCAHPTSGDWLPHKRVAIKFLCSHAKLFNGKSSSKLLIVKRPFYLQLDYPCCRSAVHGLKNKTDAPPMSTVRDWRGIKKNLGEFWTILKWFWEGIIKPGRFFGIKYKPELKNLVIQPLQNIWWSKLTVLNYWSKQSYMNYLKQQSKTPRSYLFVQIKRANSLR